MNKLKNTHASSSLWSAVDESQSANNVVESGNLPKMFETFVKMVFDSMEKRKSYSGWFVLQPNGPSKKKPICKMISSSAVFRFNARHTNTVVLS